MKEKGDLCILVGYSTQSKGCRVYNKTTRMIVESIHIRFDEIREVSETSVANDTSGLVSQQQKALSPNTKRRSVRPAFENRQRWRVLKVGSPILVGVRKDLGKLQPTVDTGIFVGYAPSRKGYRIHNKRTRQIMETIHVQFDKLTEPMAPVHLDADHAGCIDSHKSTSGGIQFLGDKLVSWMSKKQNCTAMSSAEAEYVALSAGCAQVIWMRTQLQDYDFNYNKIPLCRDSQSAIAISCNLVQYSSTKHIHTRYHFIKEQVENDIIELYFVRTEYQFADMFTKALPEDRFKYLVRQIGMRCLTPAELEVLAKEST
nr:retrovirus-related Pol polyprotein from transposon TNT 1-94 [Tanacetum cinerariifolium]